MTQATEIAKILLTIKAITLNPTDPYRYSSGIISPIYCDNRLLISHPTQRQHVIQAFLDLINQQSLEFDVVAGTATAGIPHAAWIADRLNKPMVYVRSNNKNHGKQQQIEGQVCTGQTAIVIEDLISTGGSAIHAALTLRKQNVTVKHCLAIFSYQLKTALDQFQQQHIQLHTLTNFQTLIDVAVENNYLSAVQKQNVLQWQQDPAHWHKNL